MIFDFSAITIFPMNPTSGLGLNKDIIDCQGKGEVYLKCEEDNTYSKEEVLNQSILSNSAIRVKSFCINDWEGMVHTLKLPDGMISHDYRIDDLKLKLKKHLQYQIFIMDPKIQYFNDNPEIFPRTFMEISENETRAVTFFLKLSWGMGGEEY